jgi:hypothetical protein
MFMLVRDGGRSLLFPFPLTLRELLLPMESDEGARGFRGEETKLGDDKERLGARSAGKRKSCVGDEGVRGGVVY